MDALLAVDINVANFYRDQLYRNMLSIIVTAVCLVFSLGISVDSHQNVTKINETEISSCDINKPCPLWSYRASASDVCCRCRDNSKYKHEVQCESGGDAERLRVKNCYCLYYEDEKTLLTACIFTCFTRDGPYSYTVNRLTDGTKLNELMCNGSLFGLVFNRNASSRFCGKCLNHHGIPVYSYYFLQCIKCRQHNIYLYIAVAFGPLTVFYIIMISFRISATSGNLNGYIFFCQIITSPIHMRFLMSSMMSDQFSSEQNYLMKLLYTSYGIWNLDFFRLSDHPFCFNDHIGPLEVFSLDYLVALYPLLLMLCTYIFLVLHDKNIKVVIFLWKPFHKFFARFRTQWSIRTNLVHAFCTFLLLSYVKILNVSFDLLLPTFTHNPDSRKSYAHFYYDPSLPYFKKYILYFVLALFFTILCILFPLLLLFAYPCRCFHRVLNCFNFNLSRFHIFMDTFTGCYRQEPSYCRAFAGIQIFLRLIYLAVFEVSPSLFLVPYQLIVTLCAAILFAIVRPYRKLSMNVTEVVFLLYLALYFTIQSNMLVTRYYDAGHNFLKSTFMFVLFFPLLYPTFLVVKFFYGSSLVQKIVSNCVPRKSEEMLESSEIGSYRYGSIAPVLSGNQQ